MAILEPEDFIKGMSGKHLLEGEGNLCLNDDSKDRE